MWPNLAGNIFAQEAKKTVDAVKNSGVVKGIGKALYDTGEMAQSISDTFVEAASAVKGFVAEHDFVIAGGVLIVINNKSADIATESPAVDGTAQDIMNTDGLPEPGVMTSKIDFKMVQLIEKVGAEAICLFVDLYHSITEDSKVKFDIADGERIFKDLVGNNYLIDSVIADDDFSHFIIAPIDQYMQGQQPTGEYNVYDEEY